MDEAADAAKIPERHPMNGVKATVQVLVDAASARVPMGMVLVWIIMQIGIVGLICRTSRLILSRVIYHILRGFSERIFGN